MSNENSKFQTVTGNGRDGGTVEEGRMVGSRDSIWWKRILILLNGLAEVMSCYFRTELTRSE